jgi:4'-phosphopantetheinyl transferase
VEPLSTATTTIPPPLIVWSKHPKNRCAADEIPSYWKEHDVLTFLADTGMYDQSLLKSLDSGEKERVLQFTTDYFKKRFVVSRSLIKAVLRHLPGTGNRDAIIISRQGKGIVVPERPDLFFSLSYSGSLIALSVGKQKIGSDMETMRAGEVRKVRESPLSARFACRSGTDESLHALHLWTLVEAYAKLRDINPFPLLGKGGVLEDACFRSYSVENQAVFSLAWDQGSISDILLWTDKDTFAEKHGKLKSLPQW